MPHLGWQILNLHHLVPQLSLHLRIYWTICHSVRLATSGNPHIVYHFYAYFTVKWNFCFVLVKDPVSKSDQFLWSCHTLLISIFFNMVTSDYLIIARNLSRNHMQDLLQSSSFLWAPLKTGYLLSHLINKNVHSFQVWYSLSSEYKEVHQVPCLFFIQRVANCSNLSLILENMPNMLEVKGLLVYLYGITRITGGFISYF